MAKKEKRLSINTLEKLMPDNTVSSVFIEGIEVTVKRTLELEEVMGFVTEVTQVCISEENEFLPEVKAFAIRRNVATRYGNCTLPSNLNKQYALLYGTNVVDEILENINTDQYHEILVAIDGKIAHNLHMARSMERYQLMSIAQKLDGLSETITGLFSGVDLQQVTDLLDNYKGMDEQKLVEAIVAQHEAASGVDAGPDVIKEQ